MGSDVPLATHGPVDVSINKPFAFQVNWQWRRAPFGAYPMLALK